MTIAGVRSFTSISRILSTFFVLALAGLIAACEPSEDPRLVSPQVDDVWVADLHQYSEYTFGELTPNQSAWGLLKVVAVDETTVTVITTTEANEFTTYASDLINNLNEAQFDPSERIVLQRNTLLGEKSLGNIRRTRRP